MLAPDVCRQPPRSQVIAVTEKYTILVTVIVNMVREPLLFTPEISVSDEVLPLYTPAEHDNFEDLLSLDNYRVSPPRSH